MTCYGEFRALLLSITPQFISICRPFTAHSSELSSYIFRVKSLSHFSTVICVLLYIKPSIEHGYTSTRRSPAAAKSHRSYHEGNHAETHGRDATAADTRVGATGQFDAALIAADSIEIREGFQLRGGGLQQHEFSFASIPAEEEEESIHVRIVENLLKCRVSSSATIEVSCV